MTLCLHEQHYHTFAEELQGKHLGYFLTFCFFEGKVQYICFYCIGVFELYKSFNRPTFRQGFGLTSNEALNCRLCAAVRIVRGRFGPRRPSLGRPPPSSSNPSSSPIPRVTNYQSIFVRKCQK
jgi:hypothetical protein